MSSVKDMISRLNTKKAPPSEETVSVSVANPAVATEANDSKAVKRASVSLRTVEPPKATETSSEEVKSDDKAPVKRLSISQRIASIKLAQSEEKPEEEIPKSSAEPSAASKSQTSSEPSLASNTVETTNPAPPVRRTSIADKIAALKAGGNDPSKSSTSTPPKEPESNNSVRRGSIADKIAALQSKPAETERQPETAPLGEITPTKVSIADKIAAMKPKPAEPESKPGEAKITPTKAGSIADKIAAMKAKAEAEKLETKPAEPAPAAVSEGITPSKRMSVADKIAAMKAKPEPEKVEEKPKPSVKSQGIAERIAAMQASAENTHSPSHVPPPPPRVPLPGAEHSDNPDGESVPRPTVGPSKRLSMDKVKFGAGINLAGLSPMAPRPVMLIRPKPPTDEVVYEGGGGNPDKKTHSGVDESGEIQHVSILFFLLYYC